MFIKIFLLFLFFFSNNLLAAIDRNQLNKLNIDALIVKDLNTNKVLYSKEAYKKIRPASLTKIMTTLIAIEKGNLYRNVYITKEMTRVEPTIAGYKEGDVIKLKDLIMAAMIKSDNDAAKAIGIAVGGNEENFVKMMNEKAKKIGMTNTNFTNPCGFDIKDHYSTPNDLLKLTEYAIKNPVFSEISKMERHTYYSQNNKKKFNAFTHNRLLKKYQYAVGVKTGYTSKAGPCFIARAKKNGHDALIVMLNSREDRWKTSTKIFEKFFKSKQNNKV